MTTKEQKHRREDALAQETGFHTFAAIVASVPVPDDLLRSILSEHRVRACCRLNSVRSGIIAGREPRHVLTLLHPLKWWRTAKTVKGWTTPGQQNIIGPDCCEEIRVIGTEYRISGHESFPCRYTWLPKAVRGLAADSTLFADEERAMVDLGVGKNMVRSIRFWSFATGMATVASRGAGPSLTELAVTLLGKGGLDPFLEDRRTLWLIHWNLSTNVENPLLAWDYLLNRWQEPELIPSAAIKALQRAGASQGSRISQTTLEQHFDAFLHTYVPTRGRKGDVQEDNLDCPLVELQLIVKVGEREIERSSGKREPIYVFRREEKPDITPELFVYCLNDFWQQRHINERTLPLREIAHGYGSPGQVFKLAEEDVLARVEDLARRSSGLFVYNESASLQQIRKTGEGKRITLLKAIYSAEEVEHA
jgi:hypothetical protein